MPTEDLSTRTVAALRGAGCVFAEDEARLLIDHAADTGADLDGLVRRRVAGEPLEVVVGWAEFCGLRVGVDAGVFVPRRRTRFMVDVAVGLARPGAEVVDLCCGTGAIGLAVAARVAGIALSCADVDPVAVRCARRNVGRGGQVFEGDLYDALPDRLLGRVDVLLVNAPYVPTDEIATMPPEAREHEPRHTLDGGADGVDVHRRVAAGARAWLTPGGSLLIETSAEQAPLTARAMAEHGLVARVASNEEMYATVVVGVRPH